MELDLKFMNFKPSTTYTNGPKGAEDTRNLTWNVSFRHHSVPSQGFRDEQPFTLTQIWRLWNFPLDQTVAQLSKATPRMHVRSLTKVKDALLLKIRLLSDV